MTYYKPDSRKSNALLCLGTLLVCLSWLTISANSPSTRIVWTPFLLLLGLISLSAALFYRYKVTIENGVLLISSRFGFTKKEINLSEIHKIKVTDKEYPTTLYRNTLLHLLLWDKKFSRFKQIELFDLLGKKLFTIDGQSIDNKDFSKLVRDLK